MQNEKLKSNGARTTDSYGIFITVHFNDRISEEILDSCREMLESSGLEVIPKSNTTGISNAISGWLDDSFLFSFSQALLSSDMRDFVKAMHIQHKD